MKTSFLTYCFFVLFAYSSYSQSNGHFPGFWRFTSIDGEVNLKGIYRERNSTVKDFYEHQQSTYLSGGVKLNSENYVWHPNFLLLNLGGEYNTLSDQDDYLVNPDRAEIRTLKGLNIATTLFQNKPVTLNSWANWNDTYSNRELLTNIKTVTRRWGSALSLQTKLLPISLNYNNTKWDQTEVKTDRAYLTEHENFEASTRKSFSTHDRHELTYSHNNYFRRDANLFEVSNMTDIVRLNNNLFLDKKRNFAFRSLIYNFNQKGMPLFKIFNSTQNLIVKLPANLNFTATYNLYDQRQEMQKSRQNKMSASLDHKLFSSLTSTLLVEHYTNNHSLYVENRNKIEARVNYTKEIPKGRLNLAYSYSWVPKSMKSEPVDLPVVNEEYVLTDGEITMLERPYIDIGSVIVKDVTGTIIYHPGIDYLIIQKGVYLEVQRIPGGQIENNSAVYIDYIAGQSGSYEYDAITNNIYANVILFERFIELYYRGQFLDYHNVVKSDLLTLNYIKQNTFGGKLNIKFVELGMEYQNHNSTITPYKMMRYYFNIQKRIEKFILAINGNSRNYDMVDEHIDRRYNDISGSATYMFSNRTRLNLNVGYRKQRGPGIDLDLLNMRTELKMIYRRLYITIGADLFNRTYINDNTDFTSVFLQLTRKF